MSFTGLKTGNFTDINNQGEIRLGTDLETGTAGQVIKSQGETLPAIWDNPSAKHFLQYGIIHLQQLYQIH